MRSLSKLKTWAVISDIQIPWQDKQVLALVTDFILDQKPDGIILNGDVLDCYAISDFNKNPDRIKSWGLTREITEAGQLMHKFKNVREKWWLGGNHEDRWRRVQWQFPNLAGMLKGFPEALRMADHGFSWKPYGGILRLGKLFVTHGDVVSKHSGQTARAHYDKYGNSVLVGHTHRLAAVYHRNSRGEHGAYENGCLCRLDPEYAHVPNWQQGFSMVKVFDNGLFRVDTIPVLRRRIILYGSEKREI